MRIALFVHCYYPEHFYGTESYTRTLARELLALGHEPVVVTATFAGEPRQEDFIQRYAIDGVRVIRFDRNRFPDRGLRDTFHLPDLATVHRTLLDEIQPDIIHVCHLLNHTSALLDVARGTGKPVVATFTDFFGFCFNNKLSTVDGTRCAGPNRSRSNCVACAYFSHDGARAGFGRRIARIAVSETVARMPRLAPANWRANVAALKERPGHLSVAYGAYAGALTPTRFLMNAYRASGLTVPLELSRFGIDIDRSDKPPGPSGRTRLGFIGQLARHKGLHLLLCAMRRLDSKQFSLDVYGDETMDPAYAREVRQLAEGLEVVFRGTFPVERTAEVLAAMDVLVIPSTWVENSPLILLQALATHTPVVISDVEGMNEFIEEGRNGFGFTQGSDAALTRVIGRFAAEPGLARAMSALTQYERTSRHMAADVVRFYESVQAKRQAT
ncbi:glycosyltransferase family 4 protein [Xanthobacter sp. 91]|uniref:glycosyltransferase family 4 protein n=1 Tax=Xanthobacter sp. 91 TaxID=1117244 RepID=UPI0004967501|nr:glycosyltransferase family 4 protein [Xanthobacter sp. 91]